MKHKLFQIPIFLLLVILVAGCDKYLDINDNPNQVTNPPINGLLATATYQTGLNVQRMGNITSYYVQQLASPNQSSGRDTYKEEDLSGTWTAHYNVMTDINRMMAKAAESGSSQHLGVAKILMSLNLNMLINMFGDVPYSEAFKGQELLTPKYDNQEALHDTCIRILDEALTELNKTDSKLNLDKNSDLIHGGYVAAWIKSCLSQRR
jgi:hypothetical protein